MYGILRGPTLDLTEKKNQLYKIEKSKYSAKMSLKNFVVFYKTEHFNDYGKQYTRYDWEMI